MARTSKASPRPHSSNPKSSIRTWLRSSGNSNALKMNKWLVLLLAALQAAQGLRTVCYWNGKSYWREGVAKVTTDELKPGLQHCTHLIYGFAAIDDDDYHIKPVDKKLDSDKGKGQWRAVAALRAAYPGLSILLSIGGNEDTEDVEKYLEVLEKQDRRTKLVSSISAVLKEFRFDGIDLAWQFPPQHEKHTSVSVSSIWHKFKKTVGLTGDSKASEHRDEFTALVRELKAVLRPDGKQLSIALLPHVNTSVYYDVRQLMPYVDMVNLWAVDYRTPERSSDKADYATPTTFVYPRIPHQNVDATVSYWLQHGAEPAKVQLGIATWGRTWKLNSDSGLSGAPPLTADGPGEKGPHTKTDGLLAYFETCVKLVPATNPHAPANMLRRVPDTPGSHLGTYGFRLPDASNSEGLWVSFEEPQTAASKAIYAKQRGLGGVAILDLAMDDARGTCETASPFPITKAAKSNLGGAWNNPSRRIKHVTTRQTTTQIHLPSRHRNGLGFPHIPSSALAGLAFGVKHSHNRSPYAPSPSPAGFKYNGTHSTGVHPYPYAHSPSPVGFNYSSLHHKGHSHSHKPSPSPAGFNYSNFHNNKAHSHLHAPSPSPVGFNYSSILRNGGHSSHPYKRSPSPAGFNHSSFSNNKAHSGLHVPSSRGGFNHSSIHHKGGHSRLHSPSPSPAGFNYSSFHHRGGHAHPHAPAPAGFNYSSIYNHGANSHPHSPSPSPAGFNYNDLEAAPKPVQKGKKKFNFTLNPFKWF